MSRFIALLAFAAARMAVAGINLTPTPAEPADEDGTVSRLRFESAEGNFFLAPPEHWQVNGESRRLRLTPPNKNFAEGVLDAVPLPASRPLDEAAIEAFRESVRATLPPTSDAVSVVYEAGNTLMPGGNPSFEVVLSYQLFGHTFQRSALLVHGPREQLVFRFTALKSDFAALMNQFRRSVMSWQFVEKPTDGGLAGVAGNGAQEDALAAK